MRVAPDRTPRRRRATGGGVSLSSGGPGGSADKSPCDRATVAFYDRDGRVASWWKKIRMFAVRPAGFPVRREREVGSAWFWSVCTRRVLAPRKTFMYPYTRRDTISSSSWLLQLGLTVVLTGRVCFHGRTTRVRGVSTTTRTRNNRSPALCGATTTTAASWF